MNISADALDKIQNQLPQSDPEPGEDISNRSLDSKDSVNLLYLFSTLSVLSFIAILLVGGYGIYRIESAQIIADAEINGSSVAQLAFSHEQQFLMAKGADGKRRVGVSPKDFPELDRRMRDYLQPFNIYKIKVFSLDKTIVYSTDRSIVGQVDSNNAKLNDVLATGAIRSKLEKKNEVRDLANEARFDVDVVEAYVPIRSEGAIVGSFEVYVDVTPSREKITALLSRSIGVLAVVLMVVFGSLYVPMRRAILQTKRALNEMHNMACTDILTGISNRRALFTQIKAEYSRMHRMMKSAETHAVLAFLMLDIDHFKKINDTHGHLVGDEILREVASRLAHCMREYDVIGRYGGEEFLAMLPHTDLKTAAQVAERVRQRIRSEPFIVGALSVPVTVSIGVAFWANETEDVFTTIQRADEGLYRAKLEGRDRVVTQPEAGSAPATTEQ